MTMLLKASMEQAAREAESAGDLREWSRAMRRLCLTGYAPPVIEVGPELLSLLEAESERTGEVLGNDLVRQDGGLVFRRIPVRKRAA